MEAARASAHVEALYIEHHDLIRDSLIRMCRNRHTAEDLTSETFERALRHLSRDGAVEHANPVAWLRTIAKNLLTDYYRKAATRRETPSAEPFEASDQDYEVGMMEDEALRTAHRLLEPLTPGQRTVMVLRALHGYDTQETAALMSRSPQAIRSLRHKAMRRLAESRDQYEESSA